MKKLLFFITTVLILFCGAGCKPKKIYRIGISQCSTDDWRAKMNQEIKLEALLHDDVEIEIRSADDDSRKQIADLEYFSNNNFDVIVVAPNEAEELSPEVKKIYDKGIPVIIFDRNINDTSYTQHIGVDNVGLGKSAAEYALSLLPDSLLVLELFGLPGSTPARERSRGFREVLKNKRARIVASEAANWQQNPAKEITDSLLALNPGVNLIFAHNDRMAIGASESARSIGRDDVKIIGIDAAPFIGVDAVNDGVIDASFLYPTEGHIILRNAINLAKGVPVEREIIFPTTSAVDSTNADILILQNQNIEEETQRVLELKDKLDNYVSLHNAQTALVYAIIAILILLFGVLFLVLRTFWSHKRHQDVLMEQNRLLQEERDKQKELNEKLEEATQSKLVFYTNVSHDLRTPLTLIAEPVAQLNNADNLTEQQKALVKIADKNVKILQRLINQILDFRKFENNKLTLSLSEIDFNRVLADWLESFNAVLKKRHIKLVVDKPNEDIYLALDVEKIERVFFNLISNALKYSPDNSTITVTYFIESDNLVLKVQDTGEGISKEDIANIFDRFFQVDRVRPRGSGIGLSLAKAFVELHGGTITVESELKKGSTFTVTLPVRHIDSQPIEVAKTITQEEIDSEFDNIDTEVTFDDNKPILLIIDDNKDIRELVTRLMKDDYNIITAPNGKEGIRKAAKYVPDLIVCDVMMPGIDGMETCARIKGETLTSHIPVLMLTACSLDEQKVQGFESGADGYLSKPFSSAVLKSQAASLIANRKRIKDVLGARDVISEKPVVNKPKPSETLHNDIDNEFYNKFLTLFEEKISDPNLNVEAIASQLGFERTQFYRKLKAITNYSPVELMRNIRLKKARTLLKTTDKTVSEICYEVGFSNPAYFSKCYKEQYGETPSNAKLKP